MMGPEFARGSEPVSIPRPHPEFVCDMGEHESVHGAYSDFLALLDECLGNDRVVDQQIDDALEGLEEASIEERREIGQLMLQHGLTHEVPFDVLEFSRDESPFHDLVDPLDEDGAASFDSGVVSEFVSDGTVDYVTPDGKEVRKEVLRRANFRHVREFEPSHFDVPPKRWDAGVDVDHPTRGKDALERYEALLLRSQEARRELDDVIRHSYYPVDMSSFTDAERQHFMAVFTEQLVMPVEQVDMFCEEDPMRCMPFAGAPSTNREPNQFIESVVKSNLVWDEDAQKMVRPDVQVWPSRHEGEMVERVIRKHRVLPAPLQLFSRSEDPDCPEGTVRVRRMITPFAVLHGEELRLFGPGAGTAFGLMAVDPWVVGQRHRGDNSVLRNCLRLLDEFAWRLDREYVEVKWTLSDGCRRSAVAPAPRAASESKPAGERLAELDRARERRELMEASNRWQRYIESREELGWEFVGVDVDGAPRFLRPVAAEVSLREKRCRLRDEWREWDAALALQSSNEPPRSPMPRKWDVTHREHPLRHPLLRGDR